ncbi:MAG: hypothetical protein Q7U10_05905 [Thermodesulfovibrionia bacterium]|nr:hypothetical protein [Thermodesulfovibrionia bacterium]
MPEAHLWKFQPNGEDTGARRLFPTDDAILKSLYMAALELERKWTVCQSEAGSRPILSFEDRIQ